MAAELAARTPFDSTMASTVSGPDELPRSTSPKRSTNDLASEMPRYH